MEIKLNILKEFFENPNKEFHLRELARKLNTNHTKIRNHLNKLVKEEYLKKRKDRIYLLYGAKINQKFLNLKIYYNLEKLRKSKIIEDLEEFYDFPTIILFGSYSKGIDDNKSDLDLFVISNIKKKFNDKKYEKKLNRKINLFLHTKSQFNLLKKKSKELINSLTNGIVLSGQLEVL